MTLLILAHISASLVMAGVIWSVQCVQYPLFAEVESSHFGRYHRAHMQRIGRVVIPAMLIELATGIAILWSLPRTWQLLVASALLAVAWLSTFAIQVPLHRKLATSWSEKSIRALVRSNWIRTLSWTGRAAIVLSATPQWLAA